MWHSFKISIVVHFFFNYSLSFLKHILSNYKQNTRVEIFLTIRLKSRKETIVVYKNQQIFVFYTILKLNN